MHRIGRTGRAGATGEAISLVSRDEEALLRDIERLIKRPIPRMTVPSYQPSAAVGATHDVEQRPAARTAGAESRSSSRNAHPARPARREQPARSAPSHGKGPRQSAGDNPAHRPVSEQDTGASKPRQPASGGARAAPVNGRRRNPRHHPRGAKRPARRERPAAIRWSAPTFRRSCSRRIAAGAKLPFLTGTEPRREVSMDEPKIAIQHNPAAMRFEAVVDGMLCRSDYRLHGDTMMLVHTEVPAQLEGKRHRLCAREGRVQSCGRQRHGRAARVLVREGVGAAPSGGQAAAVRQPVRCRPRRRGLRALPHGSALPLAADLQRAGVQPVSQRDFKSTTGRQMRRCRTRPRHRCGSHRAPCVCRRARR